MNMPLLSAADFVRGDRDATVVIVHYGDFECPYSGALHTTLRELESRFENQIAVVFRHFPLGDLHPRAKNAAVLAQAAGEKFWAMHDLLFANQSKLSETDLLGYARKIGLENSASESPAALEIVENSIQSAQQIGLHGTPSVFINGEFHDNREGLWKMSRLLPLVETALQNAEKPRSGS